MAEHEEQYKEHLFGATCYSTIKNKEVWLIDNECTNYMTHDASIFKELKKTQLSKVIIGNGKSIDVK